MQAMPLGSVPRLDMIMGKTSFQSVIWMARLAKQTHKVVLMGFGPLPYEANRDKVESRRGSRESRGI